MFNNTISALHTLVFRFCFVLTTIPYRYMIWTSQIINNYRFEDHIVKLLLAVVTWRREMKSYEAMKLWCDKQFYTFSHLFCVLITALHYKTFYKSTLKFIQLKYMKLEKSFACWIKLLNDGMPSFFQIFCLYFIDTQIHILN